MKARFLFAVVLTLASFSFSPACMKAAGSDLEDGVRQMLGLSAGLRVGDPAFNEEVRKRVQESKSREQFMLGLMKQSDVRDLGVNFYSCKSHLSSRGSDRTRRMC